jgi:hypothetical protein
MKPLSLALQLLAALSCWVWMPSTLAAERVVLRYSQFRETIPVADLTQLAETGEASSRLNAYLKLANQNPQTVQSALTRPVTIDPVTLDRILHGFVGDLLLDQLTQVIHTPTGTANNEALRGALMASVSDDKRLSTIEVLQKYPTQEIWVDGNRLVSLLNPIQRVVNSVKKLGASGDGG